MQVSSRPSPFESSQNKKVGQNEFIGINVVKPWNQTQNWRYILGILIRLLTPKGLKSYILFQN